MRNAVRTETGKISSRRMGRGGILRALREERGGAFVEMALVLPILTVVLIGTSEFGRMAYYAIEVANAAHAGGEYGIQSHITASNTAGIQAAAAADAPDLTNLTTLATSVTQSCVCSNGTTTTCSSAATTCSGVRIVEYVQVNTSATVNTMFTYPGMPTSYKLSGQAIMRVEE